MSERGYTFMVRIDKACDTQHVLDLLEAAAPSHGATGLSHYPVDDTVVSFRARSEYKAMCLLNSVRDTLKQPSALQIMTVDPVQYLSIVGPAVPIRGDDAGADELAQRLRYDIAVMQECVDKLAFMLRCVSGETSAEMARTMRAQYDAVLQELVQKLKQ